ncbi:hypothetical protein TUN199_12065, partial [Pyrenophora tritici-repentis]
MVQAKCYDSTTEIYGQIMQGADAVVGNFCDHGLAGYFVEGQTKYRCSQLHENLKFEFWVAWKGSGGLTLDGRDCKRRLRDEIYGCSAGGESVAADWYFR